MNCRRGDTNSTSSLAQRRQRTRGLPTELPTQNAAALIPLRDPALRGQYVILGAHFDHLGRSSFGAMDPDKPTEIHNGADDNASGTVTVMELARLFATHSAKRSVIAGEIAGLKLTGVRPGSPADSAGLKSGDVIIELGGTVVKDLNSYSDALYAHQPGEKITIVALRDGKRVTVQVTLGRRGS